MILCAFVTIGRTRELMKQYDPPKVTEYGRVTKITERDGNNKNGDGDDEYSELTSLTGSIT